jgi:hypothetical protein
MLADYISVVLAFERTSWHTKSIPLVKMQGELLVITNNTITLMLKCTEYPVLSSKLPELQAVGTLLHVVIVTEQTTLGTKG